MHAATAAVVVRWPVRIWICLGLVCVCLASASAAPGRPSSTARDDYRRAVQLDARGEYEQSLVIIEHGLAAAPRDLPLLGLKGAVLLKLRDYTAALAAYRAYLDAGATGANRRDAEKIVDSLRAVESTFLDIALASGSAIIYLNSKTQGAFCSAAPSCHKALLPGVYKVIAESPGFERWTASVTVDTGKTSQVAIALVEQPSLVTVHAGPPGARVMVDDTVCDGPTTIPAGAHRVVVALAGHATVQREIAAHEGKPVELDIALVPLVPIQLDPPGAQLALDDRPAAIEQGGLAIPPGAHVLVARAPGFRDRRVDIPAERPADYRLAVELPRIAVSAVPPANRFTTRRKIALGVGGIAPVALTAGIVLGRQSRQLDSEAYMKCESPLKPCNMASEANALNQRAGTRALQANIAFGVAGAAVIAAAVLWFTGAPEARVTVAPHVGDATGLDLVGRF
jgi:hypothetical protein